MTLPPLSPAQSRLWFLNQGVADQAYNVPVVLRLDGALDVPALQRALMALVERHEVLRTEIVIVDDVPRQRLVPAAGVDLSVGDPEVVVDARARAEELSKEPFDLSAGVPLRVRLLRVSGDEHLLLLLTHHIVCDGHSLGIVLSELGALYSAEVTTSGGSAASLPDLPLRYSDYAWWQHDLLGTPEQPSQQAQRLLAAARARLGDAPRTLDLPGDAPDPTGPHEHRLHLGADALQALEQSSRSLRATPAMVCHAAVAAVLSRAGAGEDLPLGTVTAGRSEEALHGVVGFFNNPLVVRTRVDAGRSLADLVAQVRQDSLTALAEQDLPFDWVVRELNPPRDQRPPIYQISVEYHPAGEEEPGFAGLHVEPVSVALAGAKLELSWDLAVLPGPGGVPGLEIQVSFDPGRYDMPTVARLTRWVAETLAVLAASPDTAVGELPLLDPTTAMPHRQAHPDLDRPVLERVLQHAADRPDDLACLAGTRRLTYADLIGRASATARLLDSVGVRPGQVVPVLAERGPDVLVSFLALRWVGAVYLPLDPTAPAARLQDLCLDVGADVVVAAEGIEVPAAVRSDRRLLLPLEQVDAMSDLRERYVGPDPVAYVIFTSGSTGRPKGALVHPEGMINNMLCEAEALGIEGPVLSALTAPLTFDISVWQMMVPLLFGGTVRPVPVEVTRDPVALFDLASTERWGMLQVVPSLLEAALDEWDAGHPLPRLDLARLGVTGEALPPTIARRWLERFPAIPLVNCYGPTECSDDVTHAVIDSADQVRGSRAPIGRSTRGSRLYVLDRDLRPVPPGAPGELYVGGVVVGRGYLGDPARTAMTFVADPFTEVPGARMYRTGDTVRLRADGHLEFCGRNDHQVKVRGQRVELGEIEHAIRSVAGVRAAAARVVPDARGLAALSGYWTGDLDTVALRSALRERLPEGLVPAYLTRLPELPLNANGKVDRARLPMPSTDGPAAAPGLPSTPEEAAVCAIFSEVLGRPVGPEEGFFEVGGHSLLAVRVAREVTAALSRPVTTRDLFAHASPASLCRALLGQGDTEGIDPQEDLATLEATLCPPVGVAADRPDRAGAAAGATSPRVVLLTGATGFLGAHLLRELLDRTTAEIRCPVRAASPEAARARVLSALVDLDLRTTDLDRVVALPADLARPDLGMAEEDRRRLVDGLELIVHNAATVSFARTYGQLRDVNVLATRDLLRIASEAGAALHFVSTTGAIGESIHEHERCALADLDGGYEQTKWVAERLVEKAAALGVPAVIHRPGRISAHSRTGHVGSDDAFWAFVRACGEVGAVPEPGAIDFTDRLLSVDDVAASVVVLAVTQACSGGTAFHHVGRTATSFDHVAAMASESWSLPTVAGPVWESLVSDGPQRGPASRTAAMLLEMAQTAGGLADDVHHGRVETDRALQLVGRDVSDVDDAALRRCLDRLRPE